MQAKKLTRETISKLGVTPRNFPAFQVGDTVSVSQKIVEGDKTRLQVFEGDVIAIRKGGISSTFTVRKISANSISVEKVFPYYSPKIESLTFVRSGKVRRAKLFYMRKRVGKAARVKERIVTKEQREQRAAAHSKQSGSAE